MYAVVKSGGKQYRVQVGSQLKLEKLDKTVGDSFQFAEVLALGDAARIETGVPLLSKAVVEATVVAHGKHDKVKIFKMRRRKHYQKRQGHRQNYTEVRINSIAGL